MNLSYIRYFVELAHVQHYTNAARNLNITQPSLSHAISQLEEELGVMLFEKNEHSFIKDTDVSQASFLRALSFVMYNRSRQEIIGVSCKDEPIGEIDVFAVHEKTFIE